MRAMFQPIEFFIGLRYTRAKRRNHFISFISLVSILGIALGITVIVTVLSVMNGFQTEMRTRILGMTSHATVTELRGRLDDWGSLATKLDAYPQIKGSAPYIEGQAMLINGQLVSGVSIRGVLPQEEPKVSDVGDKMVAGQMSDLRAGDYGIILGRLLADALSVGVGDKIMVITPQASVTPAGILPRLRRFTVTGVFEVGMSQYDRHAALIHLDDAVKLYQMRDGISGLRLKVDDLFKIVPITRQLENDLGADYWISDWTRQHANYFRAVQMEKTMMFIIMTLIVAVAAFNIVSMLIMVVTDKQADIAILRTLGLTPRSVMSVFMIQGTFIGVFGTMLGIIGGVLLSLNLEKLIAGLEGLLGTKFLSPDIYYISDLPSDLQSSDVVLVASVAFLLSVIATIYPAWRASRTQPAQALRYE